MAPPQAPVVRSERRILSLEAHHSGRFPRRAQAQVLLTRCRDNGAIDWGCWRKSPWIGRKETNRTFAASISLADAVRGLRLP